MLTDIQRSSLVEELRASRIGTSGRTTITRRDPDAELPLSYGQEQLWFIDQLAPGRSTYTIVGALHLDGPLDAAALERAVRALVDRHEVLRTRLESTDGVPSQVVDPTWGGTLRSVDLTETPEEGRDAAFDLLATAELAEPFDLARGPLVRFTVVARGDDRHTLLVAVHHAVFDGWSFGVLCGDLMALYDAEIDEVAADLPELPVQFGDFSLWERERLAGEAGAELANWWRETLEGAGDLDLPTDRPRPPVQTYDGATAAARVDAEVMTQLRSLAQAEGTTLYVVLMTAFQTLLHRWTDQDDIVVGTVTANRDRAELTPLIGYLVNTLAVRGDLSGDPTFRTLLKRLHGSVLEAYAHQALPFAAVVDALGLDRDASRHPVFQAGFTLVESATDGLRSEHLKVTAQALDNPAAKFDLMLAAVEDPDGLALSVGYPVALFDHPTVERLLGSFVTLLRRAAASPDMALSDLPLLTEEESRREVERGVGEPAAPEACLHELFEQTAAAHPDRPAVRLDDVELTYAELDRSADSLAARLRCAGVAPGALVGICMERSVERVVAVLAVLKAGGGYVPLDPDYPADRLAFIVDDAGLALLVTDPASRASAPTGTAPVLVVGADDLQSAPEQVAPADAAPGPTAGDVAYVIYTSGSTGRPKGVVVEHRQAANFALAEIGHWAVGPGDRVLQFASFTFDVSVLDHFVPLLSGATMVLGRASTLLAPPRLAELMRRERVTFTCLPPAVLGLLDSSTLPDLRLVISGGEALPSSLARAWCRPGLTFVDGYGPTETTVGATQYVCTGAENDPVPIGAPLAGYRAYVLDARGRPVPQGMVGELHIGGAGVARGYLNRPDLDAARFVADPFAGGTARMYRTGDFARRNSAGDLVFLGRRDGQVKIRGLRVELGEIEALLAQQPEVAQAVVVVDSDAVGQPQIVGYVRPSDPASPPTAESLRAHLALRLPRFMVPAHLLVVPEFPLTPNGKLDRAKLPQPERVASAGDSAPPRTVVEAVLVDTFSALTGLGDVAVDDSFFDLGGNSLQAMQLITRLREDLDVDLDVTAVFVAPTPRQLAGLLATRYGVADRALATEAEEAPTRPLEARGRAVRFTPPAGRPPLFLVHAIGGGTFAYGHLATALAESFDVVALEAPGLRADTRPATGMAELVAGHVAAVREAQPTGPYRLGGWSMGGTLALAIARELEAAGEEVRFVALVDTPVPDAGLEEELDDAELAEAFAADAVRVRGDAGVPAGTPDPLSWLARVLGADTPTGRAEVDRRFAVYCAHLEALTGHRPRPVRATVLVAGAKESPDTAREWASVLGNEPRTLRVPGDHYSHLSGEGARILAEGLLLLERLAGGPQDEAPAPAASAPVDVCDVVVPVDAEKPGVPLRIHRPKGIDGAAACLLYFHSDLPSGKLDRLHPAVAQLSADVGAVVVSVGSSTTPDQCYRALQWLAGSAAVLTIDPGRIAVAGDGTGAGLAARLTQLACESAGPRICFQYLDVPELDDPRATDLSGLPSAYIAVAQFDPLRDQGLEYARRLTEAGVPVDLCLFAETVHDSGALQSAAVSRRWAASRVEALRRGLGLDERAA